MATDIAGSLAISPSNLVAVDTEAKLPVGTTAGDNAGNLFLYLKGVASVVVGSCVLYYPNDYTTARTTKAEVDKLYPIAIAMAAIVADRWGWFQISGKASVLLSASTALAVALYSTGTAGVLSDTSSSQTKINRIVNLTTVGGSQAVSPCWIAYPSAG